MAVLRFVITVGTGADVRGANGDKGGMKRRVKKESRSGYVTYRFSILIRFDVSLVTHHALDEIAQTGVRVRFLI